MEREQHRPEKRKREDTRDHKQRYDRDRSRSPPQRERRDDRRRDRTPPRGPQRSNAPNRSERDRDRGRDRDRHQSSTPPPPRKPAQNNARSIQPPTKPNSNSSKQRPDTRMANGMEDEDSEQEMQRIMGFKDFRTTKDTKVPGNDKNYGVHKVKKTEYRQYMNRVGGFNRPLSPTRM